MKSTLNRVSLIAVLTLASCSTAGDKDWRTKASDPDRLHRAIKQVTDVIIHDIFSPPVAGRIYAYVSVAAYETIAAGDATYLTTSGQLHGFTTPPKPADGVQYCFELAAVEATLKVGRALVFSEDKMDTFYQSILQEYKSTGMPEDVFERSIAFGQEMASHIITWANDDNYKQTRSFPKYSILDDPATWKPTPPAYMDGIEPHWNSIRTFLLDSSSQFKPKPPTLFSMEKNSPFYMEAMETYQVGKSLTEEQRKIAAFWDCNPFIMNVKGHVMFATKLISPGGHWINITKVACQQSEASVARSAEAYMLVAIAVSDAFISCWDEKYRSKLVRPETYINQYIDEDWVPLLQTPPFPEYTSGHSVISGAAAVTLTHLFGDHFSFTDSTESEYGMGVRSFTSFIQASDEAAISRLYGGIHYRPAIEHGVTEGRAIGDFFVQHVRTRKEDI